MSTSKSATNSPRAAAYSSPSKSSPSVRRATSANSSHASYSNSNGAAQNTHNGMRNRIATATNVFFMWRQYSTFSGNVGGVVGKGGFVRQFC